MRAFLIAILLIIGQDICAATYNKTTMELGAGVAQYKIPGHQMSYGLRIGMEMEIKDYFVLQGSYTLGGEQKNSLVDNGLGFSAEGYSLGAIAQLPVSGQLTLFAATGMMLWNTTVSLGGSTDNFENGTSIYYGFGGNWQINKKTAIRLAHYTSNIGDLFPENFNYTGISTVFRVGN